MFANPLTSSSLPSDTLLRVPNPSFIPSKASSHIEHYLATVRSAITHRLTSIPFSFTPRNKTLHNIVTSLKNDSSIIIKNADKNLGVCVVDTAWYTSEVLRQLNDTSTYTRLPSPNEPTPTSNLLFARLRLVLHNNNLLYISSHRTPRTLTKLAKYLLQLEHLPLTLAKFYLLIKVHKTPLSGRPIVSGIKSPTVFASKYIDSLLQPIMRSYPSFIKDSFALLHILNTTTYSSSSIIFTADVVSLYPSIDINDGLKQLHKALALAIIPLPTIHLILSLTQFVLCNNYITFGDSTWLQIKGTAMGTPLAVTFANIYLSMLEIECFTTCHLDPLFTPPTLYKRFVDDIIAIFDDVYSSKLFLTTYNNLRPLNIHITHDISLHSGIFMDIKLLKGPRFTDSQLFDTIVYQKPMNSYLYIPQFSAHSNFSSIVIAELKRYRTFCSSDLDYHSIKNLFFARLLARGYIASDLNIWFASIPPRSTLLTSRLTKVSNTFTHSITPIIFKTPRTPRTIQLNLSPLLRYTQSLHADPDFTSIFPTRSPIICYTGTPNLGSALTSTSFMHPVPPAP